MPKGSDLRPLNGEVWLGWLKEATKDGGVRLHYLLDRRQLPADYVSVIWLWQLDDELPDDRLAGYDWGGWCSPFGFRLGERSFNSDVVFAFRRVQWSGQSWLLGVCLVQRLTAVFKGNRKGALAFDEAYPGEDARLAFGVSIQRKFGM